MEPIDISRTAQLLITTYGDEAEHIAGRRSQALQALWEHDEHRGWTEIKDVVKELWRRERCGDDALN